MALDKYTNLKNIRDVLNKNDTKHGTTSKVRRDEGKKSKSTFTKVYKYIDIVHIFSQDRQMHYIYSTFQRKSL